MTFDFDSELSKWTAFITENIRGKKTQKATIDYVSHLLSKNSVIIFNFEHLAKLLGVSPSVLASIVNSSHSFYNTFTIPKRNGNSREIASPYPVLMSCQKWIYENLLLNQPLHSCSKGFIKNVSIVDNAKEHLGKSYLLKMDIEDFFPSIPLNRVISVFKQMGYNQKVSYYLASICCLHRSLPQGAPTSPSLSNIIAKRLDKRLHGLSQKLNLSYTRYADDLTFSGNELSIKLISYIERIVEQEGFKLNSNKTKLLSENKQKIVTGISISSGKLTIPKSSKRELRKNIYHLLTKGLFEHQKVIGYHDPIYIERLLGYLHFWRSIEPQNKFVIDSIKSLKEYTSNLEVGLQHYE